MRKFFNIFFISISMLILIGSAYIATHPKIQVKAVRNEQRQKDVVKIADAVQKYTNETKSIPEFVPRTACGDPMSEICRTTSIDCIGLVDLSEIVVQEKYLVAIPTDPTKVNERGTGYYIAKNEKDEVRVCAPHADGGEEISLFLEAQPQK